VLASKLKYAILPFPITEPNSLFSKIMITICEKFGTSGNGTGLGSMVEVGVVTSSETTIGGVSVGKGNGITVDGEGGISVKAGWQAEARKETRQIVHKRGVMIFISASFRQIIRVKSKCIENATNICCLQTWFLLQSQSSPNG
jgi:hypothetical protein